MRYDKLVRDKIPDKIIKNWETPIFHIAWDEEYSKKLNDKLMEELEETIDAEWKDLISELADLKEVILAILDFNWLDINSLNLNIDISTETKRLNMKILNLLWYIDYIFNRESISINEFENIRLEKLEKRWWFKKRIILEETI